MTRGRPDDLRARAEAAFRKITKTARSPDDASQTSASDFDKDLASKSRPVETTEGAMDEYRGRQEAERAKTAKLREQRLTVEANAQTKPKGKAK